MFKMTSRFQIPFCHLELVIFAIFTISIHPNFAQVGLNCTGGDDCDEQVPCPPGSQLDKITGKCICNPDHCMPSPQCRYTSKVVIKHNATREPGDCCDIYECVIPEEPNCTDVKCPVDDVKCPSDSLNLPKRHIEGECCGIPGGCECSPAPCPKPNCQPGFIEKVTQPGTNKPGSCCPVYECQPYKKEAVRDTCKHDGQEKLDGEKWKRGNCQECICIKGEIHCTKIVECPPLPKDCHIAAYTESSCCPSCYDDDTVKELAPPEGCKSGRGIIFKNDQSWYEDECTKCTCVKGEAKCLAAFCITKTCQNATWEEGDCCPRCNGDSLVITPPHCPQNISCNMKCKNGFVKDAADCFICKCKEEECKLECPNGYLKDEDGNEICECANVKSTKCPSLSNCHKKCKYGYKSNKQGCPICKCEHACKSVDHSCKKNCPHGLQTDHKGCLICKCRGSPYSSETNTSGLVEQECNTDVDIWRDDGEAWNDGCRQCYCHKGKEMCALIACPKLDCPDPVVAKQSCCPTCPGNETRLATQVVCYGPDGLLKLEGESWSMGCVDCICHGGGVMCNRAVCPPAPCSHPLQPQPGKCCPTCTEEMQPEVTSLQGCGDDRPAGSTWREGNCVSCICANGIASCFTESCHQVDINCKTPLQVKNLCCSICLDGGLHDDTCLVGNVTLNLGEKWTDPDKCKQCTCDPGRTLSCIQTKCETSCSNNTENPCKDSEGITDFLYMFLLCAVMCLCGAGLVFAGRLCCLRRHQLKIYQPHPPAYPYKYVPTFEGPTTQTSPLTLKSPV